jgi:dipeptidyl aminopeptidase/acylaminoacyl peptidase
MLVRHPGRDDVLPDVGGAVKTRTWGSAGTASRARAAARCSILIMSAGVLAIPLAHAAVPLEVYGRLPKLENVALSPDGSRVAYVRTTEDTRTVAAASLADRKQLGGLRIGEQKLRDVAWADNDHLLIVTSATTVPLGLIGEQHEWYQLQVLDLVSRKPKAVPDPDMFDGKKIMNVISGQIMVRRIAGHTVLFVPGIYVDDVTLPALFRIDLQTGGQRLIRQGDENTEGWLVDEAGEVVAESDYVEKSRRWVMKIRRDGHLQEALTRTEAIDVPEILGYGPTPDTILLELHEDGDTVWRLVSLKDGSLGPPMAEHRTLGGPIEDRDTYRMIGGVYVEDEAHYVFFDPALQKRWDAILKAFEGDRVSFVSASSDFKKYIVLIDSPADGYRYALVDMNTHNAEPLGNVYEGLTSPFEVRRITYKAADGLEIPAYLTLPRGVEPKKLPLIVLAHGGPADRDTADFDWWPQALAEQGYAVLQANFRGSTITQEFLQAGFGQWGRKMQTDLSDGVRYLAKEGIADPARVCIVGASYGGYAALAGVTLDPGVYRCAVSVAGVSDLKRMLEWEQEEARYGTKLGVRYWDRFMGVSGPKDPQLETISPIRHIDAVSVPVLLIHGKDDTVVPFEQSTVMFDALRRAKKDVQMVTLKHEDHWLSHGETRLQMLQLSVDFLKAHNPPGP